MKAPITSAQAMQHPAVVETINTLGQMADRLRTENEALRQQLEQAQKDAERYRWLRDSDDMYVGPEYTTYNDSIVDGEYKNFTYMKPEEFDAAIDAAMESSK